MSVAGNSTIGAAALTRGQAPTAKTHFYSVEYKLPVSGLESVATLDVVFFVPVDAKAAESFLREHLRFIINSMPPKTDVLASAWGSSTGKAEDEARIKLLDGSNSLIFWQKRGTVTSWLEYLAEESKTPVGAKTLDVVLDWKAVPQSTGEVVIEGTTTLPDHTSLMISLEQRAGTYSAQAKVAVLNGRFTSGKFANGRGQVRGLPKGTYNVRVTMPIAAVQPASVQKVIGARGELLSGPLVKVGAFGISVELTRAVELP